jgi:hypothetical protein
MLFGKVRPSYLRQGKNKMKEFVIMIATTDDIAHNAISSAIVGKDF